VKRIYITFASLNEYINYNSYHLQVAYKYDVLNHVNHSTSFKTNKGIRQMMNIRFIFPKVSHACTHSNQDFHVNRISSPTNTSSFSNLLIELNPLAINT
jgi:hypothetical protein